MTFSAHAINLIQKFEGFSSTAYKPVPSEKYFTIGYGHYGPDVKPDQVITQADALNLLKADLASTAKGVTAILDVFEIKELSQNQFDALCSLAYNIGIRSLMDSTLIRLMAEGKPKAEVAAQFDRWVYSGKTKLPGLVKRRAAEKALFLA